MSFRVGRLFVLGNSSWVRIHLMAFGSLVQQRAGAGVAHLTTLQNIAQQHKATVVQIALAWAVQQGVAVISEVGTSMVVHITVWIPRESVVGLRQ